MADTDAKRAKIGELLEYIESRLHELEEEKEELKEFQNKDKERRCLEYALYARELEEVGEALQEVEEERRGEVHNANVRRATFDEREREARGIEAGIKEARIKLEGLALAREEAQGELTEIIRRRTALKCIVDDMKTAGEQAGGQHDDIERELARVGAELTAKEAQLAELTPQWEDARAREKGEKRRLEEASARLTALFAKQGRVTKFRTVAERDKFLQGEISSMQAYKTSQSAALEGTKTELSGAENRLVEIDAEIKGIQTKIEDGRRRVGELQEEIGKHKEQNAVFLEQRKDLWREDTKLENFAARAADELRTAERALAGMMDKASKYTALDLVLHLLTFFTF